MSIKVDLELIKKYQKPGPRYTSYPTAPQFSERVGIADWEEQIRLGNRSNGRDLSLYFHLPFCDTLCWFCGCTVVITRRRESINKYLRYLFREIDLLGYRLNPERKVVQLHFGGGTPTYLSPHQLRRLTKKIKESFRFSPDAEMGCEMDPRDLTRDHIVTLREAGFNRASMGVQDFNLQVQKAVNRMNPPELLQEVVQWIREEGFESLNLDLIYGLPYQTTHSFAQTLETVIELNPDRLAIFNYAHVPWLRPHQKLIKERDLPPPEEKISMLRMIIETLTSSNYVYIGMDHFAKPTDQLAIAQKEKSLQRNFQGYSTKSGTDIYGFGMSSISQLESIYAQNFKQLPRYYERIDNDRLPMEKGFLLSKDDKIRREIIMRLMCDMALDYEEASQTFNIDFMCYFERELESLSEFESDGLIVKKPQGGFTVTDAGRLFIRDIAMLFDAYLEPSRIRFSQTV